MLQGTYMLQVTMGFSRNMLPGTYVTGHNGIF